MTIVKCDRCGKVLKNFEMSYVLTYVDYYHRRIAKPDEIDLCESCLAELKCWLRPEADE